MTRVTNQTLEEQLAQRLYEVDPQGKGSSDIRPWSSVGYITQQRYQVLAKECLRQMEYARKVSPVECGHCGRGEGSPDLALAPKDWTPSG